MKLLDILNSAWAIHPEKLKEIVEVYKTHMRGDKLDLKSLDAKFNISAGREIESYQVVDGIAIIEMSNVISKKLSFFSMIFGGSSTLAAGAAFKAALADDQVKSILFNIDSPGGPVDGVADLAELIYSARGEKPITTFTDGMLTSGAYWIGSAADKVMISSDTVLVGSIGVIATHIDYSRAIENEGIKVTEIIAGQYKNVGTPYKPLSALAEKVIQGDVDYIYSGFIAEVAKHRGVDAEVVLENMADAKVFIGKQAISAGLVDGVTTYDALLNKLSAGVAERGIEPAISINKGGNVTMSTAQEVKEKNPEVYAAIFDAGVKSVDVGAEYGKGLLAGAEAESKRIQEVEGQLMAGHEDIIKELKFDGKTTGAEAAIKVLAAEKALKDAKGADFIDDGKNVKVPASAGSDKEKIDSFASLPLDEQIDKTWEASATIRDEFGDKETYASYMRANDNGQVKVLKK